MTIAALPGIGGANSPRPAMPAFDHVIERPLVRALSADAALLAGLPASPRLVRVHSVFDRVINVDSGGDRLLTLAQHDADDAPDTVVVDVGSWAPLDLMPGAEVFLSRGRIQLGDALVVALEHARPWQGQLPAYARNETTLRTHLPLAQSFLERHGRGSGLQRCAREALTNLDRTVVHAFRRSADGLCRALARCDESAALTQIGQLVGLGPGLTPAGDDFLVGLLAALNIPGSPRHECRRIGTWVVECAGGQTNLISAAALRHAANGRVRASLIELCDALMHATSTRMLKALDTVLRIGSTSGTDIALGVLAGFRLHLGFDNADQMRPAPYDTAGGVHGS